MVLERFNPLERYRTRKAIDDLHLVVWNHATKGSPADDIYSQNFIGERFEVATLADFRMNNLSIIVRDAFGRTSPAGDRIERLTRIIQIDKSKKHPKVTAKSGYFSLRIEDLMKIEASLLRGQRPDVQTETDSDALTSDDPEAQLYRRLAEEVGIFRNLHDQTPTFLSSQQINNVTEFIAFIGVHNFSNSRIDGVLEIALSPLQQPS